MAEILRREREERIATVTLFANIIAGGLGVNPGAVNTMLKAYRAVVSEYAYTPEYAEDLKAKRLEEVTKKLKKQTSDDALLKKVQQYSDTNKKE